MGAGQSWDREQWIERLPLVAVPNWAALAATMVFCLLAFWARLAMAPYLPSGYPYVTFFPAVLLASFLFGARKGMLAGLICGLLAWYYFIPTLGSFALEPGAWAAILLYLIVVGTQVTLVYLLQQVNARLAAERERNRALAETRETLFRELQHRVSNNLQVVAALLALQKKDVADEVARAAMEEASRRLQVIGRISRQLYDPDGAARGLKDFLEPLCADVVDASGRTGIALSINGSDRVRIDPEAAVPVALIVAESVANAIEHGFAGRDGGAIDVAIDEAPGRLSIEVRDDGHGLPPDFDPAANDSLGLRLVKMLAGQIGGRFELEGTQGCCARLSLPR